MTLSGISRSPFIRFALVGGAGFFVDYAVLIAATDLLGPYFGRLVSFACAMTFTYALNRRFSFAAQAKAIGWVSGWFRFAVANSLGALLNLGVYSALVWTRGDDPLWQMAAVAAGSIAGLGANYLLSSRWVFRSGGRDAGPADGP